MPGSASRERVGAVGMIGAVAVLTPVVTGLIGVGGKKQEEEARREKETPVVTGLIGVIRWQDTGGATFLERPRQKDIERQRDKSSSSIGAAGARRLPTESVYSIMFYDILLCAILFHPILCCSSLRGVSK